MKVPYLILMLCLLCVPVGRAQQAGINPHPVYIAGAMRNVMLKGQLHGTIDLDTISSRQHLYGLGPVEGLRGEILIIDGKAYKSAVVSPTKMSVEETFSIKAPFFVYGYAKNWNKQQLPSHVKILKDLEEHLEKLNGQHDEPFVFKLMGKVKAATIHVVNLPEGTKVTSPDEAHLGQVNYDLYDKEVIIVGFFSKKHKAVFTHHDTFLHMHLITVDNQMMGHLDYAEFKPEDMHLYVPE